MMTAPEHGLVLQPSLSSPEPPAWPGAMWIGEVWVEAIELAERNGVPARCRLQDAQGYGRARLLVRSVDRTLGFVDVDVADGEVDFVDLENLVTERVAAASRYTAAHRFGSAPSTVAPRRLSTASVVICTRDRVELLKIALTSVLALDHPDFEVIVVDNAATTTATRDYVRGLSDPRVRLVEEPLPGVSRGRNAGLLAATGEIVAFADDDVAVDRYWLRALVEGFARGDAVSCVSGIVPAGELRTPAQAYFEARVGWSVSSDARVFELASPPADVPLFPFQVRCYGTGANFAVERDVVLGLGGFDETLGAGAPTAGGEDLDLFFRVLHSGRQLVHEPAAIVWHRHRADNDALLVQTQGYGLGLGAWLAKIVSDPVTARLAVRTAVLRAPAFLRHLRAASDEVVPTNDLAAHLPSNIQGSTLRQMVRGARAYRRAQREQRRPAPLLKDVSGDSYGRGARRIDVM